MENASKALLIAVGILFALMILSLAIYVGTSTTRMAQAQDEKRAAEELMAFNAEYQAFNKSRMYGTDIITVVNKAINYNGKLTPGEANKAINIEIELTEDFVATKQEITEYANGEIDIKDAKKIGEYSLEAKNGSLVIQVGATTANKIVDFFQEQSIEDKIEIIEENRRYIKKEKTFSSLSNFKRAIFTCKNCDDTNNDGRIDYIKIIQYTSYKNYY